MGQIFWNEALSGDSPGMTSIWTGVHSQVVARQTFGKVVWNPTSSFGLSLDRIGTYGNQMHGAFAGLA
jgi:hypothetical protein